jgi:hypothetical protein
MAQQHVPPHPNPAKGPGSSGMPNRTSPQGEEGRSLQPGKTDLNEGPAGNKTQPRDQA